MPGFSKLRFHESNLGMFAPDGLADSEGYITIHDSYTYREMSRHELHRIASLSCERCDSLVRAAALVELAERDLEEWRESN
jgi:hypothetical protein